MRHDCVEVTLLFTLVQRRRGRCSALCDLLQSLVQGVEKVAERWKVILTRGTLEAHVSSKRATFMAVQDDVSIVVIFSCRASEARPTCNLDDRGIDHHSQDATCQANRQIGNR
jgi:hypothetical protein